MQDLRLYYRNTADNFSICRRKSVHMFILKQLPGLHYRSFCNILCQNNKKQESYNNLFQSQGFVLGMNQLFFSRWELFISRKVEHFIFARAARVWFFSGKKCFEMIPRTLISGLVRWSSSWSPGCQSTDTLVDTFECFPSLLWISSSYTFNNLLVNFEHIPNH